MTHADFEEQIRRLRTQWTNTGALSPWPDRVRSEYLSWTADAEQTARRYLRGVPIDQFASARWGHVINGQIEPARLWTVADGDAKAQLEWLETAVADLKAAQAMGVLDFSQSGPWPVGQVRVFISHLSEYKAFAGDVAQELATFSIHGFVAHDAIDIDAEWELAITEALRTAHVLVGLFHPGFAASFWAQQEVGWALGRGIPVLMIRLGEDPTGFKARSQAASARDAAEAAQRIVMWHGKALSSASGN